MYKMIILTIFISGNTIELVYSHFPLLHDDRNVTYIQFWMS